VLKNKGGSVKPNRDQPGKKGFNDKGADGTGGEKGAKSTEAVLNQDWSRNGSRGVAKTRRGGREKISINCREDLLA